MKKQILFLVLLLAVSFPIIIAQVGWKCGTPSFRMPSARMPVKNSVAAGSDTATLYIPVTVNIVGTDNGSGYYTVAQTLDALCRLQADFDPYGFHFYLENLKYINSSAFYDMTPAYLDSGAAFQFIEDHNTLNTMNVYITSDAEGTSGFVSYGFENVDYSSYPVTYITTPNQGIMLDKDYLNIWDHIFTHEAGHFFGLEHTFSGASWTEFQATGTPDTIFASDYDPENDTTYHYYYLVERVDGLHCEVAGDYFCDTPPDYLNNGFQCNANKESNTVQTDPSGATFRSDGTFFMSYSNDACQERFSPDQVDLMRDIAQGPRDYLLYDQTPPAPFPPSDWALIYPPDKDTVTSSDSITLEWDVSGADFYLLDFGRVFNNSTYAPTLRNILLQQNTFKVAVSAGFTYYWKISAVSKYYPCTILTDTSHFVVPTVVDVAEAVAAQQSLRLYPNPVSNRLYWRLPEAVANPQTISVQLFDTQGRLLQTPSQPAGQALDVQGLTPGMYSVKVVVGERVYAGRFVKR